MRTSLLAPILLVLTFTLAAQSGQRGPSPRPEVDLGKQMSSINTGLMQVAVRSAFFLQLADQVGLTVEQRKKLEEIYFEAQKFSIRQEADLDVADAELRRLLSNDRVDIVAVRLKVKEIQALRTEQTINGIEAALQAIGILTHEQHIKVSLLTRSPQANNPLAAPVS